MMEFLNFMFASAQNFFGISLIIYMILLFIEDCLNIIAKMIINKNNKNNKEEE